MFEHHSHPLLPMRAFLARVARFGGLSAAMVAVSLAIGTIGYHALGSLSWVDALLNASMILSGMGPVDHMGTTAGKLFSTAYALYSGIAFVTTVAVLLAPVAHRFLHVVHLDLEDAQSRQDDE